MQLEDCYYSIEYIKGSENFEYALSRVTISPEDLKSMNDFFCIVMIRRQKARMVDREKACEENSTRIPIMSVESRSGQLRVAKILRKPSECLVKVYKRNFIQKQKYYMRR